MTNAFSTVLQLRNNGTNQVVFTDPAVSAAGVVTELKVEEPGRRASVTLSFPTGFEVPPGSNVEFSVKTDHPQVPLLKVPVIQFTRPVKAPEATLPQVPVRP